MEAIQEDVSRDLSLKYLCQVLKLPLPLLLELGLGILILSTCWLKVVPVSSSFLGYLTRHVQSNLLKFLQTMKNVCGNVKVKCDVEINKTTDQ